jgi:hypothetical protein
MKKSYTILAIIAIIVVAIYVMLPKERFAETVFPLGDGAKVSAFDDNAYGGTSLVSFEASDSLAAFQCTLGADEKKSAWCGMFFDFDPTREKNFHNWKNVDTLYLDVDVAGTDEILVKVWTFDPDITDMQRPETFKLLLKEVPVKPGRNQIAVPFEHFYIPDFWYNDLGVKRSMSRMHHESVARVEISAGWKQPRGKKFVVNVRNVFASGVSNTAYGIFLFMILGLMIVAIGRRHPVKEYDENK